MDATPDRPPAARKAQVLCRRPTSDLIGSRTSPDGRSSHRGPRDPNRTGRRRVQRAVRRRRRVARSSCAPPLRPRRIRGDGDEVLDLPPPAGAVRGTVLPAHHAGARQRVPRADREGRRGQDRVLDRQRGLLPRDERRGDLGQPGLVGRPHHRRLPGQRRVRAALPRRRRRDVRRAPTLRLRLRRQRRRVPHDRRGREHHRRVGRRSSRTSSGRRWPSRTCSACACTPSGSCATVSTTSSTPSSPAAAATCTRDWTPRSATPSSK